MENAIKHNFKALYLYYFIGIVIFIITAIILVYYSLGYRYDFEKNQVFQTGIIRLYPIQNEYSVYVDDKILPQNKIKKTTEITNLLPKNHSIKIQADEYQEWHKNILVNPKTISNEQNILLIPQEPKINDQIVFDTQAYNQDNNQLAFTANQRLSVANLNRPNDQKNYDHIAITANSELEWISPGLLSIINTNPEETSIQILNTINDNITQLNLPYSINKADIIGIDPLQSNLLIIHHDRKLLEYDLNHKSEEIVLNQNVSIPKLDNNQLYYYQDKQIILYNFVLNTQQSIEIGEINNYYLTPYPEYLILSSKNNNQLYDLNQQTEIFNFTGKVTQVNANQELNILIKTDKELIVIDFTHRPISYQTIIRLSQEINQASWLNNHNIVFTTNHELRRIDAEGDNNQLISTSKNSYIQITPLQDKINAVLNSNDQLLLQTIDLTIKASN